MEGIKGAGGGYRGREGDLLAGRQRKGCKGGKRGSNTSRAREARAFRSCPACAATALVVWRRFFAKGRSVTVHPPPASLLASDCSSSRRLSSNSGGESPFESI